MSETPAAPPPGGRLLRWLDIFEEKVILNIATALMSLAVIIMFYEAASRSLLGESHWWAEEAVRILVVWAILGAFGVATRNGNYIRMSLLVDLLPRPAKRAAAWLNCLVGLVFSICLLVASIIGVIHLHKVGMLTESNLDLPLWIVRLALPIGAFLYALYFVRLTIDLARGRDEVEALAH